MLVSSPSQAKTCKDLSAFVELFSASFNAYPACGYGSIPGGFVQVNKTVRGLRFSAILS